MRPLPLSVYFDITRFRSHEGWTRHTIDILNQPPNQPPSAPDVYRLSHSTLPWPAHSSTFRRLIFSPPRLKPLARSTPTTLLHLASSTTLRQMSTIPSRLNCSALVSSRETLLPPQLINPRNQVPIDTHLYKTLSIPHAGSVRDIPATPEEVYAAAGVQGQS